MYSQRELLPWAAAIRGRLGEDPPLFDAHTHLGLDDPAGLLATEEDVVGALEAVDSDALVFALKEPSGVAGGNDKVLELVSGNGDRLKALARLDPGDDPLAEAERCLEAGAVGLKLHPRGEGFELSDARLDEVFALADERRLPIMIHAGVGTHRSPAGRRSTARPPTRAPSSFSLTAPSAPLKASPRPRARRPPSSSTPPGGPPAPCGRSCTPSRRARSSTRATSRSRARRNRWSPPAVWRSRPASATSSCACSWAGNSDAWLTARSVPISATAAARVSRSRPPSSASTSRS